ncbi:CPBP family intramembrane glutamic endopeptidase [Bacillus marinisedimentorum]|uniref:CPBP family intramembrane glutamic endopeptidase n=1 Tax=Bacillus marinisedimentorum TaxID=1821260 RepID=UPI000872A58A|nr:type II CAAX endopeptidase family protein [Bacillus marinisedimentorum]
MKCCPIIILISSVFLAHLLLFASFSQTVGFWNVFSLSLVILILIAVMYEKMDLKGGWKKSILLGFASGLLLYFTFYIGKLVIIGFNMTAAWDSLSDLYKVIQPEDWKQYAALFMVIIPGEELFWRGYVQKRLSRSFTGWTPVILGSLLYASAQIYSGSILLILSAIVAGLFFGSLYKWKQNMALIIIAHLIFDTLLMIVLPII